MPTRRKALFLFANALVGSGAVASGAFENASAEVGGDLQVLADRRQFPGFRLKPGRPDGAYVVTDDEGFVEKIVLNGAGVPGEGLNRTAETRFERLVLLCNQPPGPPIEELYFEFQVSDEGLGNTDPTPAEIESVLFIASAGGDVPGDGTQDFLEATDHGQTGADKITPNEELPFGIGVDLGPGSAIQDLPDPETFGVTLVIEATRTGNASANSSGQDN